MYNKKVFIIIFMFILLTFLVNSCVPTTPTTYTLTATAGENGQIDPEGEVILNESGTQVFTIAPDEGYMVDDVLVDDLSVGAVSFYVFTEVSQDHTIEASFIQQQDLIPPPPSFTILASAGTGGSIDPEGSIIVQKGEGQSFTITPESGYEINDVVVDAIPIGKIASYTFQNVEEDHTIEASFIPVYTLTMLVTGDGSTTPSVGTHTYLAGTVVDITAIPSCECYPFTEWNGNASGSVNPTTITMDSNKTVTANFGLSLKEIYNISTGVHYNTIQGAIDAAVGMETIFVCPGIYYENIEFDNKRITVRSANPLDSAIVATTIIHGTGFDSVVKFVGGDESVLLGFTIQNGNINTGGGIYVNDSSPNISNNFLTANSASEGGGIYLNNSSPMIIANTITGNTATYSGGGIFVYSNSAPFISNNTITSNRGNSLGGGMTVDGSSPTITANMIIGNTTGLYGGGMHISNSSSSVISNNTIIGNRTEDNGGGMYIVNNSPDITGNTIKNNKSIDSGGGIFMQNSSSNVSGNTINNNSADSRGGGVYIYGGGYPNFNSNIIQYNDAPHGGGIYVFDSTPYINSNAIEDNTAVYGAGIETSNCDPQIINNDFINNKAENDGGGVYVNSDSDLTPYDPRPTGWGNSGDSNYRQEIPTIMLDPAEGVEYFIAGNKFLGNEHEYSSGLYNYSEGAHVYFE